MKQLLYYSLLLISMLLGNLAVSQNAALTHQQIERIAKTSQLWGHIKYFHPFLDDASINWEYAFTSSINNVINASTSQEYEEAVQQMLNYLNDPATHVISRENINATEDTIKYPVVRFIEDSILTFTIHDYRDLEDQVFVVDQIGLMNGFIPKAKGIVFDFRSHVAVPELGGYLSWFFKQMEPSLVAQKLELPELHARFHDGFVMETGGSSGGYYSGHYSQEPKPIVPGPGGKEIPIVFIVNQHAEIPLSVLALQSAGKASIISMDPLTDESIVDSYNFKLDDSSSVSIRLNELASGIQLKADYTIPQHMDETAIQGVVTALLNGQKLNEVSSNEFKPSAQNTQDAENADVNTSSYPDRANRLLAAAKIWTVINYFFAYQDLMEDDWDEVLSEYIPRFAAAKDSTEYHLAVAEMYTHIQDGHGFIRSRALNNYFGFGAPPIAIRFIEGLPVVTTIYPDSIFEVRGIDIGDVILEVDGETIKDRIARMSRYISASNQNALLSYISWRFLNGKDSSEVSLKIQKKGGKKILITLPRTRAYSQYSRTTGNGRNHEPITRLITKDIGYADLDRLNPLMVDQMFEDFKDTRAIIFDMRGYPLGTAWYIAPRLTDKENVYGASFRRYAPMSIQDGSSKHMTFFDQPIPPPQAPTYRGKTVMLIDERTQSQAEHTGLFFEAANGTIFIGSQTAGANGDVTNFQVPGNITLFFSGHDVRHADGRQLQKIGLVPHVPVKPTIKGIRENRDEVLEKAIDYLSKM